MSYATDSRTFLDVDDADPIVLEDDAADCGASFVDDTLCWGTQSEREHGYVSLVRSR